MRKTLHIILLLTTLLFTSCESKTGTATLGALGGAAAGVGGYEYHAKKEMDRIEKDLEDGVIDQREYEIRKDQIKRDSLFQK